MAISQCNLRCVLLVLWNQKNQMVVGQKEFMAAPIDCVHVRLVAFFYFQLWWLSYVAHSSLSWYHENLIWNFLRSNGVLHPVTKRNLKDFSVKGLKKISSCTLLLVVCLNMSLVTKAKLEMWCPTSSLRNITLWQMIFFILFTFYTAY